METRILKGKKVAEQIKAELSEELRKLKRQSLVPGLAAVLVGDNPASHLYVRNKTRTCADLGMHSETIELAHQTTTQGLLRVVEKLNSEENIDGILVQLPLPPHVDEETVLSAVHPDKDVDGFHPINVSRLYAGIPALAPCTPSGIVEMLQREGVTFKGAEAVVVGRSEIVGKPMALLLLHRHATVTICHSRTTDLPGVCRRADILVAAVGQPALVTKDYIRKGAVVVDVGINRVQSREEVIRLFGEGSTRIEQFEKKGYTLVGDVHPRDPLGLAEAVTPVPGGVGPLTIAHLMKNTVLACRRRRGKG